MSPTSARVVLVTAIAMVLGTVAIVASRLQSPAEPRPIGAPFVSATPDSTQLADHARSEHRVGASGPAVGGAHSSRVATDPTRPASITALGRVVHEHGALRGSVEVHLCAADERVIAVARTKDDGAFELRAVLPLDRGWFVRTDGVVTTPGGVPRALVPASSGPFDARLVDDPPVELVLMLHDPFAVTGRVFERDSGRPIESAEIEARSIDPAFERDACATHSGADGRFELVVDSLPRDGLVLVCRADGWRARLATLDEGASIEFALDPPAPVRGRVTSTVDGRPLAGATITLGNERAGCTWSDASDDRGEFELEAPDVPREGLWMHVSAPGHAPQFVPDADEDDAFALALAPCVVLRGSVVDAARGLPAANALLRFTFDGETRRCPNGLVDETRSRLDGGFELVLVHAPIDAARVVVESSELATFEARLDELLLEGDVRIVLR